MRSIRPWLIRWSGRCAPPPGCWGWARSGCGGSGTICAPSARSLSMPVPAPSRPTRSRSTPSTACCTRCPAWPPRWCTPIRRTGRAMITTLSWPRTGEHEGEARLSLADTGIEVQGGLAERVWLNDDELGRARGRPVGGVEDLQFILPGRKLDPEASVGGRPDGGHDPPRAHLEHADAGLYRLLLAGATLLVR